MKIFVSSTVKDLGDLRDELYRYLKDLDHTPWFSEKDDFPTRKHPDSMTNCLKVTEECDLFIVLLDKRAGLPFSERDNSPYTNLFGLTISEAEYQCVRERGIPVCIFIRQKVEHESAIYRQIKDEKQKRGMKWYSEPAVYDFYDRLMHEKPNVPWRYTFDIIEEITGPLNSIIGEVQAQSLHTHIALMPPQPFFVHPYPLQKHFTGRVRERTHLTNWFTKDPRPMSALTAIGGMGKSAVSWYWIQEDIIKKGLSPRGIFWWSFYERDSDFRKFLDTAIVYCSSGETNPDSLPSIWEKMTALYQYLYSIEYLIVLDGVERVLRAYGNLCSPYQGDEVLIDINNLYRSFIDPNLASFIRRLATGYPKTKILLTSRLYPRELDDLEGCDRRDLEGMERDDAVGFFIAQGVRGTRAEIEAVCNYYGFHPLTLRLLSGMIIHDLRYDKDIKTWTQHNPLSRLVPREHHILELAYNSLNTSGQELISKISAFRSPMEYDALAVFNSFSSEEEFNTLLLELVERGLLLREEKTNRFDLHPIVRKYCYERLKDKNRTHTRLIVFFEMIPAPEIIKSQEDLAPVIELYHHMVRASRYDEAWNLYWNRLHIQLYYQFGAYHTIIEVLLSMFPDTDDALPQLKEDHDKAICLNELGNAYARSGNGQKAVSLHERSNEIYTQNDSKKDLPISLINLATSQYPLGKFNEAEINIMLSITIAREFGNLHQEAIGNGELSRLSLFKGEFQKSCEEGGIALRLMKKLNHCQYQGVLWAYLTERSLMMSDADEALSNAEKSLELSRVEGYNRDIIRAEFVIGAAYLMKGDHPQAECHLHNALILDRRINMVDYEACILLSLSKLKFRQDLKGEALKLAEEALEIADRCEYRLVQADIHNFLTEYYLDTGDKKRAEEHCKLAIERAGCVYKPALEKAEELMKSIRFENDRKSTV